MSPKEFLELADKKVVIFPDEVLTSVAKPIEDFGDWDEVSKNMLNVMMKYAGIGLAAPQVGLPYRMFVMGTTKHFYYFNPKIIAHGKEMEDMIEGCLSLPNKSFTVKRPKKIKVSWQNVEGKTLTQTYEGYTARVFQHELDHLDGKLINRFVNIT